MKSSEPAPSAEPYLPPNPTLARLRSAAAECRGCHLWERATQTVFGEGGTSSRLMLVGEQPGDHPELIVCLGATAAQSLLGPQFRLTESRGQILSSSLGPKILATVHPSSLLRVPDEATRRRELELFTHDLRRVREALSATAA